MSAENGYVKVTVVVLLDSTWPIGSVAKLWAWMRPRSITTCGLLPTWGWKSIWRTNAPPIGGCSRVPNFSRLCHEVNTMLYTDMKALQNWVAHICRGR